MLVKLDKSETRIRRMFGQIADRYDFLNHLLSLNVDRYWRWQAVRRSMSEKGVTVLDVCAGTGDLALAYYKQSGGSARVVGTDFCHEMLVIARKKGARLNAESGVVWVESDAQKLPFPDNAFQIVSVAFGLRNVTDTDRGLSEMSRVCREGGTVVILEFSMPGWRPLRALYSAYFRYVLPRVGQLLARNREAAYNYLPASVGQFPQGDKLAQRMRAAGLVDVRWQALTFGVATLYLGEKKRP